MDNSIQPSFQNNFDLIRIVAALQVVLRHMFMYHEFDNVVLAFLKELILAFPGVPIFFTVSGFLIFWSFDRNAKNIKKFYFNRFLRIYPAMWVCILITSITLFAYDAEGVILDNFKGFLLWFFGQCTFVQFWTPDFLRFWGTGFPNGSLWTISVELQFYIIVPFLYYVIKRFAKVKLIILLLLFISSIYFNFVISAVDRENLIYKFGSMSIFYYLFYFLFGVCAYIYWAKIKYLFEGKVLLWLPLYLLVFYFSSGDFDVNFYRIDKLQKIIPFVFLSFTIIALAFSFGTWSEKILKGNDLSYGIYIYHMVIADFFYHYGIEHLLLSKIVVIVLSILMAYLSWILVEKKCIALKKRLNFT